MDKTKHKILSGGETGADRSALDGAIANQLNHAGWCPKGRRAEDGPIDLRYGLQETRRADYLQRTEWNVRGFLIARRANQSNAVAPAMPRSKMIIENMAW